MIDEEEVRAFARFSGFDQMLKSNPYKAIGLVEDFLGFREIQGGYAGVFMSGDFDCLVGEGLCMRVYAAFNPLLHNCTLNYQVRFLIHNRDDGMWGGWSEPFSKEFCDNKVQEIHRHLTNVITTTLPSAVVLKRLIELHGITCEIE